MVININILKFLTYIQKESPKHILEIGTHLGGTLYLLSKIAHSNGIIASAAVVHPELVAASAESGCIGMYFGIESGNDKILKAIYKPSSVKQYLKLGDLMKKYPRIFTRGFLIIGFPHENLS